MPTRPHSRDRHGRNDVRASIAHAAARMIAEGLTDYRAAKQKAARQLGITDRQSLPDNDEIEVALKEHLALFYAQTQPHVLHALRETAIRALQWLGQFSPWLVGAVLEGTANEFSVIELELAGVSEKSLAHFLLAEATEFSMTDTYDQRVDGRLLRCKLEFDGVAITVTLFVNHAQRQTARPREHLCHRRMQIEDVQRAFSSNT